MCHPVTRTLLATLLGGFLLNAQAQDISPLPDAGLWEIESTTLINGQDVVAAIKEVQRQALSQLPAEQRAMMEAMLQDDADERDTQCITEQDRANFRDVQSLLDATREDMPGCDITLTESGDNRLAFTGNCDGSDGFTGTMQGEIVMLSAREMRQTFSGKGVLDASVDELPPGMQSMTGEVTTEHTEIARWIAAECN